VSQPRFAPITANLLARKGNAVPSAMATMALPQTPPVVTTERIEAKAVPLKPVHDPEFAAEAIAHDPLRPKKLFLALTHDEHDRLAIAAVKTGLTKHQVIRDALDAYFEQLANDMHESCHCLSKCGNCSN
jgi:hypothetical protein